MKLDLKAGEHVQIQHDGQLGFVLYIANGVLHVRAKSLGDPNSGSNSIVLDAGTTEISK